jgi:hypothetical protein
MRFLLAILLLAGLYAATEHVDRTDPATAHLYADGGAQ